MEFIDVKNISSSWDIKVINYMKLSERATLIISNDDEKFIIKRKENLERFNREVKLINHLRNNNFSTQYPLSTKQGGFSVPYKDSNYSIYNYLVGFTFKIEESLNNNITPRLLGETIADLNKIMKSADFLTEYPNKDLYKMVYGFAVNEICKVDHSNGLYTIYENLEQDVKRIVNMLPSQLIHRDAHIHNIIFNNNRLSGVIDFELVEVNVSIFDLCYCTTSVLSEGCTKEELRRKWFNFVGNLVTAYNQVNPLSSKEKESIWFVMLCIQTIFMGYFSSNESLYKINKAMFLWIYENRNQIEDKVLLDVN